jgi:hypothetical protein
MKVTVFEKCFTGTVGNMFPGKEYEVEDLIGKKLIDRGIAQEVKAKAKKKKVSNRAVKSEEITTPEDD